LFGITNIASSLILIFILLYFSKSAVGSAVHPQMPFVVIFHPSSSNSRHDISSPFGPSWWSFDIGPSAWSKGFSSHFVQA
jgi:hypothetical protein